MKLRFFGADTDEDEMPAGIRHTKNIRKFSTRFLG